MTKTKHFFSGNYLIRIMEEYWREYAIIFLGKDNKLKLPNFIRNQDYVLRFGADKVTKACSILSVRTDYGSNSITWENKFWVSPFRNETCRYDPKTSTDVRKKANECDDLKAILTIRKRHGRREINTKKLILSVLVYQES